MFLPRFAILLPRLHASCHAIAMSLPWPCHVVALLLPCVCCAAFQAWSTVGKNQGSRKEPRLPHRSPAMEALARQREGQAVHVHAALSARRGTAARVAAQVGETRGPHGHVGPLE